MGFNPGVIGLVCIMVILPAALSTSPPVPFKPSRTAFYGDGYGTSSGACGYGKDGSKFNNGSVATLSGRLFKHGAGCGACYQVRCKNKELCSNSGAIIVATDSGEGDRTDFILSKIAYKKLARFPDYLALTLLSVGGKNDITAVEVLESDKKTWRPLQRAYGAVWDIPNPPRGKLYVKFQVGSQP